MFGGEKVCKLQIEQRTGGSFKKVDERNLSKKKKRKGIGPHEMVPKDFRKKNGAR